MNRIVIEKTSEADAFAVLQTEWRRLFAETDCASFLSWEWLSVWFKWFGADKTPFILKAYRANRLVGLLPLYRQKQNFFGISFCETEKAQNFAVLV